MALPKSVEIRWDPRPPEEEVTGYEVYVNGASAGVTDQTSMFVEIGEPGTFTATVIAKNQWGDAPPSAGAELRVVLPGQVVNVTWAVA